MRAPVFLRQAGGLLRKQLILSYRVLTPTLAHLLAPFAICLFVFLMQQLTNYIQKQDDPHPSSSVVGGIPRCTYEKRSCYALAYGPSDVAWVKELAMMAAAASGLNFDTDVYEFEGNVHDCDGVSITEKRDCQIGLMNTMHQDMYKYFVDHPMGVENAVMFTSAFFDDVAPVNATMGMPVDSGYVLWYNQTALTPTLLNTKRIIDQAILRKQSNSSDANLEVEWGIFPRAPFRSTNLDIATSLGGLWFYLPACTIFFFLLVEIVTEKDTRLRIGMKMMGLRTSAYWLSWFVYAILICVFHTLMLMASAAIFQLDVFTRSNQGVVFFSFFLFALSMSVFAFFLSTIIKTAQTAQTAGYTAVLIGFVFQSMISSQGGMMLDMMFGSDVLPSWAVFVRVILSFLPPVQMARAYYGMNKLSGKITNADGVTTQGPGFKWADWSTRMKQGEDENVFGVEIDMPPVSECIGWFFLIILVWGVLAWYCDHVVSGEHGPGQAPYFFLQPSYWGFHRKRRSRAVETSKIPEEFELPERCRGDNDVRAERDAIDRGEGVFQHGDVEAGSAPSTGTFALVIKHLSKVYQTAFGRNKFPALVDMSLRVQNGEILGLLGHNGAGKTTLISVLTGITPPTEGMALVYGHDVVTNPTEVRAATGVCPQYDILWGMLTAEEHMRLFCTLKGVNNTEFEMQDKLTMTALWKIRKQRVHSFSGGMKRRLSVAMSAIGDPKIIYMDEPTTGLDPVNRRGVWELVLKMKEGRAIILTTHSMQEADVLCDRIGMMAKGCLCCLGTSLHLKQKYGTGYHIHVMATQGHGQALEREITEMCPTAVLGDRDGEGMEITIPYDSVKEVQRVLEMLEREAGEEQEQRRRVREWGLLQTSLESVFCGIMDQHEFKVDGAKQSEEHEHEDTHSESPIEPEASDDMVPPTTRPLRAMLFKSATLQKRQKCTNCCQICTPVVVLLIMLVMQLILNSQMKETTFRYLVGSSPIPMTLDSYHDLVSPFQKHSTGKPASKSISQEAREMHVQDEDDIKHQNASCLTFFLATYSTPLADLGLLASNGTKQSNTLLSQMAQRACALEGGNGFDATTVQQPYFDLVQGSYGAAEDIVLRTMKSFAAYNWDRMKQPPQLYQLPDAIVGFNKVDKSTAQLKYRFAINDGLYVLYHRPNNFTRVGTSYENTFCEGGDCYELSVDLGRMKMMSTLHTAFTELVTGVSKTKISPNALSGGNAAADLPFFMNSQFLQAMPYWEEKDLGNFIDIFGQFLYPIALSIQLPLYIYIIVMEKEDRILDLMRSMGLTTVSYYFANYIFFIMMYIVTVALFWIVGAIIKLSFFVTHAGVLLLLFLGWGHALIALAFFFASITKTKSSASIIGYGVAFLGTLLGLVLCSLIYGHSDQSISDEMPWGWNLIPMLAFCRSIYLATYQCSEPVGCFTGFKGPGAGELGQCIGFLWLDAFMYFVLSLYFNAVIASHAEAVTKHPLFFLQPLWRLFCKKSKVTDPSNVASTVDGALDPEAAVDVLAEETRVMSGACPADTPLVVKQLRKVYDNGKVALRGVSWACGKGECLGYLGENGCGKTTSMRMLTGSLAPTSGTALVGGYNIRTDIEKVRLVVGVCPQFSVVWPQLTCREHALFYARLKGVPPSKEKEAAEKALKEVGLLDFQHRHAGRLSGGMKRRLSIAIALVGGSRIIFLDEPTTGLDPVSRKGVWRVLLRAKEGRAVVLTTHAMEEAELLCNRIAILAYGRMRCIGTQQHLMDQLYSGYMLTINYTSAAAEEARAFILSLFPQAEVHQAYQGSCVFRLPTSVRPSFVFNAMQNAVATNANISNWGYSQVGLEEVFTEVIEKAQREREAEENGVTQVAAATSYGPQSGSNPRTPPELPPATFLRASNPARDPPPSPALPETMLQQV